MTPARRNYSLLSAFLFFFFLAQAASMSMLAIWLKGALGLSGAAVGTVFSANFLAAMLAQPILGYVSDKMGLRKVVPVTIGCFVVLACVFFSLVYAPALRANLPLGALAGGLYLGVTFVAGPFAIESFVDRVGRKYGFEYSRARLWGSLGYASAAAFTGRLYNLDPKLNFYLASAAGVLLVPIILSARIETGTTEHSRTNALTPRDAASILQLPKFWGFMVLILGVTNLYLVYDQQFPFYFSSLFPTLSRGTEMFGYLSSAQIFLEAGMMFVAPWIVMRTGARFGLLLASGIMIVRIAGSGLAVGPISICACKMLHSLELPILSVSIFRYIAYHFEARFASMIYLVGVSFGHSLGLSLFSPLAGVGYDQIGFQHTYFLIAAFALVFWVGSWFSLAPTPPTDASGRPIPSGSGGSG
jgi:OHS family lactose permease-like MFS transporter